MSDVVNYKRLRRIMSVPKEEPSDINSSTACCLFIITLTVMYLYKRYQDKSRPQSRTSDTLWL